MVEKEILLHGCAYNAIRLHILHSSGELGRISFKGALDVLLREWLPRAGEYAEKPRKLAQ